MIRTRTVALLVAAAWTAAALPACAQDGPPPPPPGAPGWQGAWQGQWQGPENRVFNGTWTGTFERSGYPGGPPSMMDGPGPDGMMGPPHGERHHRMIMRCSDDHHEGRIIGGVAGGVAGGVIGNRLSGGDRVAGTVIGAGAGALGGAAVGGAIDRRHDRECEDFFRSAGPDGPPFPPGGPYPVGPYEGPGWGAPGWGAPVGYMWVPVMRWGRGHGRGYTETVTRTEEFVEDGDERVVGHRRAPVNRRAPRRIVHDKRVYIGGS